MVAREQARKKLNDGLFACLFNKYKEFGPYYKRHGGKYFTVILTTLAMRVGADIDQSQLDYAKSVYKSAGHFKAGIDQFTLALKKYRNGKPYEMGSKGLYDTLHEDMASGTMGR